MMVNMLLIPDVRMAMLIMMIVMVFIVRFKVKAVVHWLVELVMFMQIMVTIGVRYFIIIMVHRLRFVVVLVVMLIIVMTRVDSLIHVVNRLFN